MSNRPTAHQYKIMTMLNNRSILQKLSGRDVYSWDTHSLHAPKVRKKTFNILLENGWIREGATVNTGWVNYHLSDKGRAVLLEMDEPDPPKRPLTKPQINAMRIFRWGYKLHYINGRFVWNGLSGFSPSSVISDNKLNNVLNLLLAIPRTNTLKRLIKDGYLYLFGHMNGSSDGEIGVTELGKEIDLGNQDDTLKFKIDPPWSIPCKKLDMASEEKLKMISDALDYGRLNRAIEPAIIFLAAAHLNEICIYEKPTPPAIDAETVARLLEHHQTVDTWSNAPDWYLKRTLTK